MNMEVRTPGGHRLLTEEDSQVWVPPTPPTADVTESEEDERNDRSRSPPPARRLFASPSAPAPSHARPLIIPNALPAGAAGHKNVYELHFEKKGRENMKAVAELVHQLDLKEERKVPWYYYKYQFKNSFFFLDAMPVSVVNYSL